MTKNALSLALLVSILAPSATPILAQPAAAVSASQQFSRLADDYWETQMRLNPLDATFNNYPRYNDRLPDNGASGRAEFVREYKALLARLAAIDRTGLGAEERVSADVMKLELERDLEGESYKFWQWNVDHMDGPQSWIPTVIAMSQPMRNAEDAEALLLRLKAFPSFFANESANLREGLHEGRVAARVPIEKTLAQLDGLIATPADKSPYAEAGRRLPQDVQDRYLPLILAAVDTHVLPAYKAYAAFLKEEYLPRARSQGIGLSALPDGASAYRFLIRRHTTVDKSPQELHQLGLDQLKEIHADMARIAKRLGHKGGLKAFLETVRRDPRNFFKTREEVLASARDIVARAQAQLPRFFGRLPKTALVVQPIEDYKEKNDVAARYYEPPDDLSRPGVYFINTYQPETRPRFGMTSLAAHEGVPGHHLQIALAMENRGLPVFRRHGEFTAFVEGWALYSERLADEMGLYQDDLSRVGMLSDQSLRACRLVVDTGIHALGWDRQRAIDFMKENTPMSEEEIVAEVDRYTIWPGQALAYKVGQLELMSLRRETQARQGRKFDLRAFHDAVLKNGALPLPVLRAIVLETEKT